MALTICLLLLLIFSYGTGCFLLYNTGTEVNIYFVYLLLCFVLANLLITNTFLLIFFLIKCIIKFKLSALHDLLELNYEVFIAPNQIESYTCN